MTLRCFRSIKMAPQLDEMIVSSNDVGMIFSSVHDHHVSIPFRLHVRWSRPRFSDVSGRSLHGSPRKQSYCEEHTRRGLAWRLYLTIRKFHANTSKINPSSLKGSPWRDRFYEQKNTDFRNVLRRSLHNSPDGALFHPRRLHLQRHIRQIFQHLRQLLAQSLQVSHSFI